MAKLTRRLAEGRWRVTIAGYLGAGDLLRLEQACAPALDRRPMPLDLHVTRMAGIDEAAALFLRRLLDRGAILVGEGNSPSGETFHGIETRRPTSP